ncbi:iron chelate uptake ABC transporter family permease subunit [Pilibacter termitis]
MKKTFALLLLLAASIFLYLTWNTYGNWAFALELRGRKLIAFVLVSLAIPFSTISFQTLTKNRFITPNLLGMDALYVFLQSCLFFFFGNEIALAKISGIQFLANILLMMTISTVLASWLFFSEKLVRNLHLILLIGMISGTLFQNASSFMQVLLDPNEYLQLQGKLYASFSNVELTHLYIALPMIFMLLVFLWNVRRTLDVLHLGLDAAQNLGVKIQHFQVLLLLAISGLTAISTALVGPVGFLGFIVANLTYQLVKTYQHQKLFLFGSLITLTLLVLGQFLVEQVLSFNATLSVVIEFVGGLYFLSKILVKRKM